MFKLNDNDTITVTAGKKSFTTSPEDTARLGDALAGPFTPVFGQDKPLFIPSTASSFGIWLLQDGKLVIYIEGTDVNLDPQVATDFANELKGSALITKAKFKVGDEVYLRDDYACDVDNNTWIEYWNYVTVTNVEADIQNNHVIYTMTDGKKTVRASSIGDGYWVIADPVDDWSVKQQASIKISREIIVQARSADNAKAEALKASNTGTWCRTGNPDDTITLSSSFVGGSLSIVGTPVKVADLPPENWQLNSIGKIVSTDKAVTNAQALAYVMERAFSGSIRHQQALQSHNGVKK